MKTSELKVIINNEEVDCIINKKSIKHIYFKWVNGVLVVSCPKYLSDKKINKIILENEKSIVKLKEKTTKTTKENEIYYLGDKYEIVYDGNSKTYIYGDKIICKDRIELNRFLIGECKRVFTNRLKLIKNEFTSLPEFSLRIRKMTSRWGVCNTKSMTVTLNTELIKKDVSLIDYVIIHELCHFKHMNHSKDFWNEVSKYYPYYKLARKALRESQYD